MEPVDEDVLEGGLDETDQLDAQGLFLACCSVVLLLQLVDELFGVGEVTWDVLAFTACVLEVLLVLLEQVDVVEDELVVLLEDGCGAGHHFLCEGLVAFFEVVFQVLGHCD